MYPSIYWHKNGKYLKEYLGKREAKDFKEWALGKSHPELLTPYLNSCDALEKEIQK